MSRVLNDVRQVDLQVYDLNVYSLYLSPLYRFDPEIARIGTQCRGYGCRKARLQMLMFFPPSVKARREKKKKP